MGFNSSVIGVWRFNNSLIDEVSDRDFEATVAGNVKFRQFNKFELLPNKIISRKGLLFEDGQSYSVDGDFSFTDITVAFWWYSPQAIGYTRHAVTRELQTKFAPIICKANSAGGDPVEFTGGTFFISEIANSKTENAIRVHLCDSGSGGNTVTHIYTSSSYKPGLRHILVSYLRPEKLLKIDIDGKSGTLFSAPSNIFNGVGDLRINSFIPERTAHVATQTGYLFDLVVSALISSENEALQMMRYGYEQITRDELFSTRYAYFGIDFPQPSTISTTQVIADSSNILVARSNGDLLRGDSPIWDKKYEYLNPRSVTRLNNSETDPNEMEEPENKSKRISKWTTSGLHLKGVTIRA